MLFNYLTTAFRNAVRHKLFTFINVFGLALSLSFCLLVIMIIKDQNSFDTFHPRPEDIYRVLTNAQRKNGDVESYASSPHPLGEVLAAESPAVENLVHLSRGLSSDADLGSSRVRVNGFFADKAFFEVFGFTLASGDPATALSSPQSMVLTSETAVKLFGAEDPLGKTVKLRGIGDFNVTGVLAELPGKTHMDFDLLGSLSSLPVLERDGSVNSILNNWNNYYSNYSYVRLRAGHSADELTPLLSSIQDRFYSALALESRDKGYTFELEPLSKITPGRLLSQSLGRSLPSIVLYLLAGLAILGMVAALFNYTNLTLARSLARAKEIGLRKVAGANRTQLFVQFVSESLFTVTAALGVALVLLQTALIPGFRSLQFAEGADITLQIGPTLLAMFSLFTIVIGMVAGLLPAAVMSGFRPSLVLKDVSRIRVFSGLTLRKALLVFQFSLSLVLLIVITVINRQVRHAITMEYGMDWKSTMTIRLQGLDAARALQFVSQDPDVVMTTTMSHHPLTWEDGSSDVRVRRTDEPVGVRDFSVDANFERVFGLHLATGKGFYADLPTTNEHLVLVNERFVEQFHIGSPADAVGRELIIGDSTSVRIAGVLTDFLYKPATYTLEPVMLRFAPADWQVIALRIRDGSSAAVLDRMTKLWKTLDPYHPIEARMYDQIFDQVYDTFNEMVSIIAFLGFLAFAISMLGLLGIVTFQVESRTKEIGVRKVLGARVRNIILLLAKNELTLLLISTVIAVPLALWISSGLLEEFAFRISPGLFEVLPALIVVYAFAALTIGWQAVRAAASDPVNALRYE